MGQITFNSLTFLFLRSFIVGINDNLRGGWHQTHTVFILFVLVNVALFNLIFDFLVTQHDQRHETVSIDGHMNHVVVLSKLLHFFPLVFSETIYRTLRLQFIIDPKFAIICLFIG